MSRPSAQEWLPWTALGWLLAGEVALLLPNIGRLPLWLLPLFAVAAWLRVQIHRGYRGIPGPWLKAGLVTAGFAGTWLSFGRLLGLEATTTLLLVAAALKLVESNARRDAYVLLFLGYFCILILFLFEQTPGTVLYALLPLMLFTCALLALHQAADTRWGTVRQAGILLMQSLPVMLLLFLVMPRFAPIWSVPQSSQAARTGVSAEVAPGDVARLSRSDRLALRVRFDGDTPPRSQLYWRGIVLSEFDGRRWLPWPDHNQALSSEELEQAQSQVRGTGWRYQVLQEPSHQPWLFALETPLKRDSAGPGQAIRLTADYRLVAEPVHERLLYHVTSYPAMVPVRDLRPGEKARLLLLPEDFNPRARAWGNELETLSPEQRIRRVLNTFTEQPFVYTLSPPRLGRDSVDEFLFQSRRGFCEHYASSFVFVMRAAGIPARVVAGYQGGEINPLTGSVLVHDYDAHAWAEVWLEGQGWQRVDPTAAVAPERVELGLEQALAQEFLADSPLAPARYRDVDWLNRLRLEWDAFNDNWALWVLSYRGERQWQVLQNLLGAVTPLRLILLLLAGAGLPLMGLAFWLWRGQRRPRDPLLRRYHRLCRRLAGLGYPMQAGETPAGYLQRVAHAEPGWAASLNRIARLFNDVRYRPLEPAQRRRLGRALVTEIAQFNPRGIGTRT